MCRRYLNTSAVRTTSHLAEVRKLVKPATVVPPIASTKDVFKKAQKKYFDPSNTTLDFALLNRELFRQIASGSADRMNKRVYAPSDAWEALHCKNLRKAARDMKFFMQKLRVSLSSSLLPLGVGDMVLLNPQSTVLNIVAATPTDLDASKYTFINSEGEISYGTKSQIVLRIPRVIPRKYLEKLRLIQTEQKYPGISPIGVPDSKFSRSQSSLPNGVPKKELVEEGSGSFSNSGDDFIVAQAASQLLTDTDVNTYVVPYVGRGLYSESLTSLSTTAFQKVTTFTNKLAFFHRVLQYDENNNLIDSPRTFPLFELFIYISNFDQTLEKMDEVEGTADELRALNSFARKIELTRSTKFGKSLPKATTHGYADSAHNLSSYIAFVVAIARSGRMWQINMQKSTKTPISVNVLPLKKSLDIENALAHLKEGGIDDFAKYFVAHVQKKDAKRPNYYEETVQMLKDIAATNISSDHILESVLGNLIRHIDIALQEAGIASTQTIPYSYEYSKSRAYEIVVQLEESGWVNPTKWNESLQLPNTKTSTESDLFAEYYKYMDAKFPDKDLLLEEMAKPRENGPEPSVLESFNDSLGDNDSPIISQWLSDTFYKEDPLRDVRENFGSTPVYCIDSETAHEVDDGISIHRKDGKYVLTVHVANPTSYIKQNSTISEIAFNKGSTVYLPEGPTMMLPNIISKICGLNGTTSARTFAIQFELDLKDIDAYLDHMRLGAGKPSQELAQKVESQIIDTANVRFYEVSNFPKGFTYLKVNEVLTNPQNEQKFSRNEFEEGSHELNLFTLFHISSILRHIRLGLGEGLEFNDDRAKLLVDYVQGNASEGDKLQRIPGGYLLTVPGEGTTPVITITKDIDQGRNSKSQQLVSAFMIAANFAGSEYAHRHGVPIIHRTQDLNLSPNVTAQIQQLMKKMYETGESLNIQERAQLLSVMTSANIEVARKKHESLGLLSYLNLTSPLRRYVDMINHWKLEEHVMKKEPHISSNDLDYVGSHLQSCEYVNRSAQRFSDGFWQASFLKHYFELLAQGHISDPIGFDFLLRTDAKHGDVKAEVTNFTSLRTLIVQNNYVIQKFADGTFKTGMVVELPRFRVVKLDFIEHELSVEFY